MYKAVPPCLLLLGDPPAPPDAFARAGKLAHALADRPHDFPLHAQHGRQHVALAAVFLRLDLLHKEKNNTSGQCSTAHLPAILKTK